jgi:transcriptional regulator with XRE-family HTH domain
MDIYSLARDADKSFGTVAKECGVSRSHISKVAGGTRMPSLDIAAKIAQALGVPLAVLVEAINKGWKGFAYKDEIRRDGGNRDTSRP